MKHQKGFTIIELLVVIVVIGILATISIVAYSGITNKAEVSSLQSDLDGASKLLKMYHVENGSYPTSISNDGYGNYCPSPADNRYCVRASPGNTFSYTSDGTTFSLVETSANGAAYQVTDNTTPTLYDPWANWYSGIAATALAGKYVYKTDLGSTYAYKTTNDAVTSPQGDIGLDPNYPAKVSLVSPQANPAVDFSAYPAQNACRAIGGRLPNMQEMLAIYNGRASYGNNFQTSPYFSSTEYSSSNVYTVILTTGGMSVAYQKVNPLRIRCVSG